MTSPRFDEDTLSLRCLQVVDEICTRYTGPGSEGLSIESLLEEVPATDREAALYYLLKEEQERLAAQGCKPVLEEYLQRFSTDHEIVLAAWDETGEFEVDLEVIIGPHRGRRFQFRRHDNFVVGRSASAHFQIAGDPFFSRVHFLIEVNPPQCRLIDLDSLNGTQVNRHDVDWADLRDGDLIVAGKTVIRVSIDESTLKPEPPRDPSRPPPLKRSEPKPFEVETQAVDGRIEVPGYQVEMTIGRGGMGEVFLARRTADDQQVAMKILRPPNRPTPEDVQRFIREAQILCAINHRNIVGFHEFGRAREHLYLTMDYVPGNDVAALVDRDGRFEVPRAVALMLQALRALSHAHELGFVHRDVKPSNLLVESEGDNEICRLTDFGLARVYFESRMSGLTLLGTAGGTLQFMAPEQVTDFRGVGPPADQYGAAATLYYMCTARQLFPAEDHQHQRLMNILENEPIPIQEHRADIPAGLARIIHKALAKKPAARFPDVTSFASALSAFVRGERER